MFDLTINYIAQVRSNVYLQCPYELIRVIVLKLANTYVPILIVKFNT